MKPRSRRKHKGRSEGGSFLALPFTVMDSPNYFALSGSAVKLLIDLGRQYRGSNNGDLSAAWAIMRRRGWKSRDTLQRATAELLEHGMIEKTRQGGLHCCNLFALTWHAIDDCGGKLDVAETHLASGLWKQSPRPHENQNASPESVSIKPGIRVYGREAA
jgi:hypothetical protein